MIFCVILYELVRNFAFLALDIVIVLEFAFHWLVLRAPPCHSCNFLRPLHTHLVIYGYALYL